LVISVVREGVGRVMVVEGYIEGQLPWDGSVKRRRQFVGLTPTTTLSHEHAHAEMEPTTWWVGICIQATEGGFLISLITRISK
jgi:hypothetical protein